MHVMGMRSDAYGPKYGSALGALTGIFRAEGVPGLYRGLWANLCRWPLLGCGDAPADARTVKVAPSISTSFFVYEWVRDALQPEGS
jgi:hypothetical protein